MMPVTPEFEQAVARACLRSALAAQQHYPALNPFASGDDSAVHFGAFLDTIAREAGLSEPQTRRRMKALQEAGRAMRSDTRGGCTRWWLAGLAETQRADAPAAIAAAPAPSRQTLTNPPAASGRQHWSDVLGVARDCSTSEARAAFKAAVVALDETDPDYPNQRRRVYDAIDACCREHDIQVTE